MGLVLGIITIIASVVLGYQGACLYKFLPDTLPMLSLGVSDANAIICFLSLAISTRGLILAIAGVCMSVISIIRFKKGEELDKSVSIMCIVIIIFGILSVL